MERLWNNTRTAEFLHCTDRALPFLVRAGLLTAHNTLPGVHICRKSLLRFAAEYISLAEVAARQHGSVLALIHRCSLLQSWC